MHSIGASHIQTKPISQTSRASKCFYKLLSFLTWSSGYPNSLQYLFLIVSNIQYILILLTIQLDHFDSGLNSGLALTVNEICKALLLRNLTDAQIDGWILAVYIYFASMLIGACLLIFLAAKRRKASRKIKHLIVTICQFHLAIAFWLCNAILLYSLTDARDYHMKFFKIPFDRSALMAWHIFLLILNFLFGGVFAIYSYDPLKWSNEMAMSTPISQVLTFALKGIVCLLLLLVNEGTGQKWLLALFSLIISGLRHFHLIKDFPFYEHKPLRISSMLSSIAVLISFLSILILCFKKIDELNGNAIFYMEALIVCLGVKFSKIYFENKVIEYLGIANLKSEDDVLKKIFAVYYMRRNTRLTLSHEEHFSMKEIQFWGVWSSYSEHTKFTSEKVSAVPRVIEEALDARIYELLSSAVEKYKENRKLKLFLSNFILHQNEGMLKGLDYLEQLKRGEGGFDKVKSSILWEEYQKKLESQYEGNLDIKTFLQFEENSGRFVEMIYSNSKRYVNFWKTYTKPSLELMDLVNQSERIEETDERITKFWANFDAKEKYLQKEFLILYCVYLSIVRNARYAASKLRKKLMIYERTIELGEDDELTQATLMSADNFAFHVSMEKETFGKILNVSENAGRELGWRKNELISKNLEMMIPRFLRKESMLILRGGDGKSLQDPRFNSVMDCFLLGSENWIIPSHGFFCLYPNIKDELKILALFRLKKNHAVEKIIVNSKGVIQSSTKRIGQLLELEGMMERISLEDICLGLRLNEETLKNNKMVLSFNAIGDRNKTILKDCSVSIEEYPVKEMYYLIKFLSDDIIKAERQNKIEVAPYINLKSEQRSPEKLNTQLELLRIQEQEEDEEAIPSEKLLKELEFTVNSPVTSTRNLVTPKQKMVFDFSTPRATPKRLITTIGENQQTNEDLLVVKYQTSEPSFLKEEKVLTRYQSRKSEEYNQETSIVSSQASSQRMELEEVLHVRPKDQSMRALNTFFGVYIAAAIILLISFKVLHTDSTNTVTKNAEVSTAALLRLMRICNLYAQAGAIVKVDEGTFFADRYRFLGIPNLKYSSVTGIPPIAKNLLDSNIELRQYVSKIEKKFAQDLYTELPMFFYNQLGAVVQNQTTNPFELVDLLVATADRISHTMFLLVRGTSPDVLFIYKNCIDRLLVLSEQGLEVIVVDTEAKLDELFNTTIYFFVAMGVFGLALFCFFIYIANKVVKDQEKTFELFRRLDEDEIVNHVKVVEFFCSMILQSDMNIQIAAKKVQQKQSFFSESFGQKPSVLRKGKRLNTVGVYNTLIQTISAVLVLLLLIFSGYIILLALVKKQNGVISTKVNLLTSFNFQAYEQSLLKFVLPDYLGGHVNMTVRSQPFIEEWDKTYTRNLEMGDSLLQIIDPEKGFGDDEMLVQLVTGNLCEIIVTDITIAINALGLGDPCDKIVNGVARKGVKAAYDYSMYWMQSALANFQASGKTKLDSIKALNATGQKQMEMLGVLYVRTAMERISNRMEAQLQKDAEKFIHSILVVVVVYVVIYVTVVLVIWYRIQKAFASQRVKWKRLFKLVPEAIILSNKALTLYLLKNRNGNQNWMDR